MDEVEQHREAYRVVIVEVPGSTVLSHQDEVSEDWEVCGVEMPELTGIGLRPDECRVCGDPKRLVGLTVKCRDLHERCRDCGERYDQPKGKTCRRRKHVKSAG